MNLIALKSATVKAFLIVLAVAGAMFTSCIKDDTSDCPPPYNVRLLVQTDEDAGSLLRAPAFDPYNIDSVVVYVFGTDGRFTGIWDGGPYTRGEDYVVDFTLEPGTYEFAAVTNPDKHYSDMMLSRDEIYQQRPTIADLQLCLGMGEGGTYEDDIEDLLLGTIGNITVADEMDQHDHTIVIYPQTYQVNFTVAGLVEGTRYDFSVSDNNFLRTLENTFTYEPETFSYTRWAITERTDAQRTVMSTSMTMYNLMSSKTMPFLLSNATTSEQVYADNLIGMIETVYNAGGQTVDFDTTHEFDILLNFRSNLLISITVNGWVYKLNEEEL